MIEFLFSYPAELFARGELVLALPWWQFALLPLGIAAFAYIVLGYFGLRGPTGRSDRVILALLRGLALALVLFSLSRPLLEVDSPVAQPNLVGVLLDNSLSMQIADFDGKPRNELIRTQFDTASGGLLLALQQRFETRLFQFGADTQPLTDVKTMDYGDGDSNLARALEVVQQTLQGEPLAGLVVISDGATRESAELDALLLTLLAAQVPVYSIGVGQTRYARDIEISRIRLPRRVLEGNQVLADVTLTQQGYDGQTLDLVVEDDGRILHKQPVQLEPGTQTVRMSLDTDDSGARQLRFYLANQSGEQIADNNHQQTMLTVNDAKMRILYFEGEPRFELKFVRRAVADDASLGVTGLIRTADAKFYRVGIESPEDLQKGFPITREELFAYDALILGSVEISLLSREQQEMIVEFVSERGGGLLLLGGRHAFAEGGYYDSPLSDISPLVIESQAQPDFSREIKIQPTTAAWVQPALRLAGSNEESISRWQTLPPLTIVNPIRQIKPGATLLLSSTSEEAEDPYIAMAFQRYGRGKVIAFPVQNSWLWQMHHEIEIEDQSHEILWRQLLRWLVEGVPPRLDLALSSDLIHSGGTLRLRSELLDLGVEMEKPPQLRALLTMPNGLEQVISMSRHPSLPGIYETDITAAGPGDYWLRVEFDDNGNVFSSAESRFSVTLAGSEYYQSQLNEPLLRKIAIATNGAYFNAADADELADTIESLQHGTTTLQRYELWDMPAIFLLLATCLCSEWGYRRRRNLV